MKNVTRLLVDAHRKDIEDRLWQQWLVDFGKMNAETFMSFKDYKDLAFKAKTKTVEKADIKQILEAAERIKEVDQRASISQ